MTKRYWHCLVFLFFMKRKEILAFKIVEENAGLLFHIIFKNALQPIRTQPSKVSTHPHQQVRSGRVGVCDRFICTLHSLHDKPVTSSNHSCSPPVVVKAVCDNRLYMPAQIVKNMVCTNPVIGLVRVFHNPAESQTKGIKC